MCQRPCARQSSGVSIGRAKHGTWPCSRSFAQPLDTLHHFLKPREAPISAVRQNRLGVDEETGQSEAGRKQNNNNILRIQNSYMDLRLTDFTITSQLPFINGTYMELSKLPTWPALSPAVWLWKQGLLMLQTMPWIQGKVPADGKALFGKWPWQRCRRRKHNNLKSMRLTLHCRIANIMWPSALGPVCWALLYYEATQPGGNAWLQQGGEVQKDLWEKQMLRVPRESLPAPWSSLAGWHETRPCVCESKHVT